MVTFFTNDQISTGDVDLFKPSCWSWNKKWNLEIIISNDPTWKSVTPEIHEGPNWENQTGKIPNQHVLIQ